MQTNWLLMVTNSIGDENSMIEYGNDFSMMGTGPVNGTNLVMEILQLLQRISSNWV